MLYPLQLSDAQATLLRHILDGVDIRSVLIDNRQQYKCSNPNVTLNKRTIQCLLDHKVVTMKYGRLIATDLGKSLKDSNWVDPIPESQKFGAKVNAEREQIRQELLDAGYDKGEGYLYLEVSRIYTDRHKNDPTYRERQEQWYASMGTGKTVHAMKFSDEEIEYLREKLHGVNDPVGMSVLEKIGKLIEQS